MDENHCQLHFQTHVLKPFWAYAPLRHPLHDAIGYIVCKFSSLLINPRKQFTISFDVYFAKEAVASESSERLIC